MKKLFASLIFGLLVSGIVSGSLTPVYGAGQLFGITATGAGLPSTLYTINTSTGVETTIGLTGFTGCGAMDFDTVGKKMYAICGNSGSPGNSGSGPYDLITINLGTGQGTLVNTLTGTSQNIADMSFRNSDNTLFVVGGGGGGNPPNTLYTLNIGNGVLTTLGVIDTRSGNGGAFSPADVLFHSSLFSDFDTLSQVNGAPAFIASHTYTGFPGGNLRINAMDFMPGSNILFGSVNDGNQATTNYIATVNTGTAEVTNIGLTVSSLDAIAFISDDVVGGELLSIDSTALILAGAQSFSWMIPVVLSIVGIGLFVASRKSENS